MRLFVAVTPPDQVLVDLLSTVDAVRAAAPPALRWTAVERWHVTLAFLGEVPDERADPLAERLRAALGGCRPADLRIAGAGLMGSVLWVGVDGEIDRLGRTARTTARTARALGVPVDRRPYRPHLTVARTRERRLDTSTRAAVRATRDALAGYAGPAWTAASATLFRSHLGPRPRHEPLVHLPFGAA